MALEIKTTDRFKFVRLQSIFYVVALIIMLITILKVAQTIFKPLSIAVLLGFLVYPIYTFLKKLKIPRVLIIFIIFLFFFYFLI
ncbi:putative membrane spanning protein [Borrelia duttonii CR2A]|uniref:Putative membrane spanning protein n=1 Tax=Borrelia duttonii CR2A TaxID=1432657 RepID=W6THV2_9SPIR|nr:putative membrane spanning protein [Borrelia duttonii CR2A]